MINLLIDKEQVPVSPPAESNEAPRPLKAERKIEEAKEASFAAANADQAFFKQPNESEELYDIDAQKKKNERH